MFIYVHRFPRYSSSFSVSRWLSEIILVQVALKFWSMSNLDCYCNIHTYPKKGKRETSLVLHTSESSSDVFSSRRLMTFRRYFWNPSRRASTTLESFKKKNGHNYISAHFFIWNIYLYIYFGFKIVQCSYSLKCHFAFY